jgi:hypothetical protein
VQDSTGSASVFHNRMPVILDADDCDAGLAGEEIQCPSIQNG